MNPLKPNDIVFIKSKGETGTVVKVRSPEIHEKEADKFYEVQITYQLRRTDLELEDREAEQNKWSDDDRKKTMWLNAEREKLKQAIAAGKGVTVAANDFLIAVNEVMKEPAV